MRTDVGCLFYVTFFLCDVDELSCTFESRVFDEIKLRVEFLMRIIDENLLDVFFVAFSFFVLMNYLVRLRMGVLLRFHFLMRTDAGRLFLFLFFSLDELASAFECRVFPDVGLLRIVGSLKI